MTDSKPWFEDQELWELMYPIGFTEESFQAAEARTDQLLKALGTPPGGAVLDLCCGPGRHSVPLAQRGYQVTSVDLTPLHLDRLRERVAAAGVSVEIIHDNMLTFRRENAFDSIINTGSSFGYFDRRQDDRTTLENVYASLKPGGRFAIEVRGLESIVRNYQKRDWIERDGRYLLQERVLEPGCERLHNRWIFIEGDKRREFNFYLRLFSGVGLVDLLRSVGFSDAKPYADPDLTPYDHRAEFLWVIATK